LRIKDLEARRKVTGFENSKIVHPLNG